MIQSVGTAADFDVIVSVLHLLGIQQILPECVAVTGPMTLVPDIRPSELWYESAG